VLDNSVSLPTNLTGSYFKCGTNPSAGTAFTILKNGSSIGTATLSTGGVVTFSTTAQSLVAGDVIKITAPAALNSIADLMWTFKGTY
jgi:hypothetical protein